VAVAATVALLGVVPASPASAQEGCGLVFGTGPNGDEVLVWTCSEDWDGGGSGGDWVCEITFQGQPRRVACIDPSYGWFSTVHGGCYIKPASPQPPAGHPDWGGNDPADGIIYAAACFALEGVDGLPYASLPVNIFLSAADGFIPDLVEQAIARLQLDGPDIHIAPDPSGVGLVGLPVWMWTPETDTTWGPQDDSLTALGHTVSVTASGQQIRWNMGDGTEVLCGAPGTEYQPEFGAESSPTCGHAYEHPSRTRPGGRYAVTATTEWHIDWQIEGTAISGTEIRIRESSTSVRINELQVVTS
jgi:hypothetical protein